MDPKPNVVEALLGLLRKWGWEAGYKRLEETLASAGAEPSPEVRAFFLAWMAAERGAYADAEKHVAAMAASPALATWVLYVQAFVALRRREYAACERFLGQAEQGAPAEDAQL